MTDTKDAVPVFRITLADTRAYAIELAAASRDDAIRAAQDIAFLDPHDPRFEPLDTSYGDYIDGEEVVIDRGLAAAPDAQKQGQKQSM